MKKLLALVLMFSASSAMAYTVECPTDKDARISVTIPRASSVKVRMYELGAAGFSWDSVENLASKVIDGNDGQVGGPVRIQFDIPYNRVTGQRQTFTFDYARLGQKVVSCKVSVTKMRQGRDK